MSSRAASGAVTARRRALLLITSLLALLAASASASLAASSADLDSQESEFVWRLNEWRVKELGLPPMQISSTLSRSAQDYANWLINNSDAPFDHESDGRTPTQRAVAAGWAGPLQCCREHGRQQLGA